jgi:ferredoxin
MEGIRFKLTQEKCVRCDACVKDCPRRIIQRADGFPFIPAESEAQCIRCQHCLAVCPTGAISILGLDPDDSLPLAKAPAVAPESLSRFIRGRRTVRQYREENVDRALIDRFLADTAHAPTGGNTCDLTFIVIDDRRKLTELLEGLVGGLERHQKNGATLPEFIGNAVRQYRTSHRDEIFRGAPHLLIASAGEKAYCGDADVVIALSYFELLAQSHGLGTTWCDFLKFIFGTAPETAAPFGVPLERPYRAILFGYPAIRYARTVQRDRAAKLAFLTNS